MNYEVNDYEIRTWYSAKDGYFLSAPLGFEAAMSDGKTPQAAVKAARESLSAFLEACREEGWHIPVPVKGQKGANKSPQLGSQNQRAQKIAARIFARSGGLTKSPRKAAAAARNGLLGGRPRKIKEPTASVAS